MKRRRPLRKPRERERLTTAAQPRERCERGAILLERTKPGTRKTNTCFRNLKPPPPKKKEEETTFTGVSRLRKTHTAPIFVLRHTHTKEKGKSPAVAHHFTEFLVFQLGTRSFVALPFFAVARIFRRTVSALVRFRPFVRLALACLSNYRVIW